MLRSEKKFVDGLLEIGRKVPQEMVHLAPRVVLRSLRKRLRMTQKHLAKRVGLPQSYIAKIESGKIKPAVEMLEKIFRGLNCSLFFLLVSETSPDEILEQQAYEAAKKKVKYIAGTMALEDQLPSQNSLQEMINNEKKKLLDSETTRIWD